MWNPEEWLRNAITAREKAQQAMDLDLMIQGRIDEVSILFKSIGIMERFIGWVEQNGWFNFASVKKDTADQLYGNSLAQIGNRGGPAFEVTFEFLKPKGGEFMFPDDWRIECMFIHPGGFAPLHERIPEGGIAHVSWKCINPAHYQRTLEVMPAGVPKMAEYRNSYGMFSYFGSNAPHFKPRVNLRDNTQTSLPRM